MLGCGQGNGKANGPVIQNVSENRPTYVTILHFV